MITIVPYDLHWPSLFEGEAASIGSAMGALALSIEHVGSTSVPGLAAKPIIDIQVEFVERVLQQAFSAGYPNHNAPQSLQSDTSI